MENKITHSTLKQDFIEELQYVRKDCLSQGITRPSLSEFTEVIKGKLEYLTNYRRDVVLMRAEQKRTINTFSKMESANDLVVVLKKTLVKIEDSVKEIEKTIKFVKKVDKELLVFELSNI